MIRVLVRITIAEGRRQVCLNLIRRYFAKPSAEVGCLEYEATVDVPAALEDCLPADLNVVTFVEKWTGLDAYLAYVKSLQGRISNSIARQLVQGIDIQLLAIHEPPP